MKPTQNTDTALQRTHFYLFALHHSSSSSTLSFCLSSYMQSCGAGLLCRQNCRDSHLPFPFLVLTIHLSMSCGAELASSLLSARCRTQHLFRVCALTFLFVCANMFLRIYVCVCVCVCACERASFASSPHHPPSLFVSVGLTLQIS